jgi:hypothetical protein
LYTAISIHGDNVNQEQNAAAAAAGEASLDIGALTNEEFDKWRETGELPEKPAEEDQSGAGEQPGSGENSDASQQDQDQEEQRKPKGGFQRRIDKLTREKHELESRLTALEGRLAEKPAERPAERAESKGDAGQNARPVKPDPAKFDSYAAYEDAHDKYVEDLADWKTDQKLAQAREESRRQAAEAQARQRAAQTLEQWESRVAAARQAHPDFDEVLEDVEIPITPALQQALVESEHGAELAYQLAKNPAEAQRIMKLSPLAQARELGKLEAKLTPEPQKKPAATNAPPPLKPVAGGKSTVDLNDPDLSFGDWEKARNAQLKGR